MMNFNKITHNASLFPSKYEILVQQTGRQNEFIRKLAMFYGTLEFIQKEYEGNVNNCFSGDEVKMSAFVNYLKYIDKPFTPKEPTYEVHLVNKVYSQIQNQVEDMDMVPLTLIPLYLIDREKSNDIMVIEKEQQILTNDQIKQQYKVLQEDLHKNEEQLKTVMEKNGEKYVAPCEGYYKEKAIMTLFYYNVQSQAVTQCGIELDNSSIGLLGNWYPYNPRENGKFKYSMENVEHIFKLLGDEQRQALAEQLRLVGENEEYNYEKVLNKIKSMQEGEKQETLNQIKSLL